MSKAEKNAALTQVAKGAAIAPAGNAKVRIGKSVVDVCYCSSKKGIGKRDWGQPVDIGHILERPL